MRLMLPDLLRHLTEKSVALAMPDGPPVYVKPGQKPHDEFIRPLVAFIHKAEKFIFDSGSDQSDEIGAAVRATAAEMIDHCIFHLPAPLVWIEDPFSDNPNETTRNYYLCREYEHEIRVHHIQSFDASVLPRAMPQRYLVFSTCVHILTTDPKGAYSFGLPDVETHSELMREKAAEVAYAVIKFIVTLATPQTIRERVETARVRTGKSAGRRDYEHTIIRVPSYVPEPGPGEAQGTQGKRRMGLVAGYVWGKNTRPVAEQRWIAPHWRGDASVGVVPPKVRVVDPRPVKETVR